MKKPREKTASAKPSPEVREFLRQIGRKGGQARSERKTEAVRRNAKLSRRRRKPIKPT
jgi:general stress protein YciG